MYGVIILSFSITLQVEADSFFVLCQAFLQFELQKYNTSIY